MLWVYIKNHRDVKKFTNQIKLEFEIFPSIFEDIDFHDIIYINLLKKQFPNFYDSLINNLENWFQLDNNVIKISSQNKLDFSKDIINNECRQFNELNCIDSELVIDTLWELFSNQNEPDIKSIQRQFNFWKIIYLQNNESDLFEETFDSLMKFLIVSQVSEINEGISKFIQINQIQMFLLRLKYISDEFININTRIFVCVKLLVSKNTLDIQEQDLYNLIEQLFGEFIKNNVTKDFQNSTIELFDKSVCNIKELEFHDRIFLIQRFFANKNLKTNNTDISNTIFIKEINKNLDSYRIQEWKFGDYNPIKWFNFYVDESYKESINIIKRKLIKLFKSTNIEVVFFNLLNVDSNDYRFINLNSMVDILFDDRDEFSKYIVSRYKNEVSSYKAIKEIETFFELTKFQTSDVFFFFKFKFVHNKFSEIFNRLGYVNNHKYENERRIYIRKNVIVGLTEEIIGNNINSEYTFRYYSKFYPLEYWVLTVFLNNDENQNDNYLTEYILKPFKEKLDSMPELINLSIDLNNKDEEYYLSFKNDLGEDVRLIEIISIQ